MSRYLSLEDAKRHLNVEHPDDDTFIESLIDSAEDYLGGLLNRDVTELERDSNNGFFREYDADEIIHIKNKWDAHLSKL